MLEISENISPCLAPFELFCSSTPSGRPLDAISSTDARALNAAGTQIAINAVNGNSIIYDKVFAIADDGLTLSVGMLWNSFDNTWRLATGAAQMTVAKRTHSGLWGYAGYESEFLLFTGDDGQILEYEKQGERFVCVKPDARGISYVTIKNNCYVRTFPDNGVSEYYRADGKLDYKEYPTGQRVQYQYDQSNTFVGIVLPSGRRVDVRDGLSLIDCKGINHKLCTYQTDACGNLTTIIKMPDGQDYISQYVSSFDSEKRTLTINSGDDTRQTLTFDKSGEIKELSEADRIWSVSRNDKQRLFCIRSANGIGVTAGYDQKGHWQSLKMIGSKQAVQLQCDDAGRLTRRIDQNGNVHSYEYNSVTGLLASKSESTNGVKVINKYDSTPSSSTYGVLLSRIIQDGNLSAVTSYEYNERRQLKRETSPQGRTIDYIYDDKAPYRLKCICNGTKTFVDYDNYGRQVSEKIISDNSVIQARYRKLDELGRVLTENTAGKQVIEKKYDGIDRILVKCEGSVDEKDYRETGYSYHGNKTIITAPNGLVAEQVMDKGGLLVTTTQYDNDQQAKRIELTQRNVDGSIDCVYRADGRVTKYVFDESGRLDKCIDDGKPAVVYIYDQRNRVIGKKIYSDSNQIEKYNLPDADGQLRFEVTVKNVKDLAGANTLKGFVTEHRYQLGMRIASIRHEQPLIGVQLKNINEQALSAHFAKLPSTGNDRVKLFTYDLDGNITSEWVQTDHKPEKIGYLTRYEYDNSNNRIREIIYLGKTVSGGKLDNIPCMITRYWYDDAGRKIAELDSDGYLKAFKYNNDGGIAKEVRYANRHLDISKDVKNISLPQEAAGDIVINHEYDVQGREFKTTNSESMLEVTRLFDSADNVIAEARKDLRTGEVRKIANEYNVFSEKKVDVTVRGGLVIYIRHPVTGLVLRKIDELNNATHYFYDVNRNPALTIGPSGAVVAMQYDKVSGEVIYVHAYAVALNAGLLDQLNSLGDRSGFIDDALNAAFTPQVSDQDRVLRSVYDEEGLLLERLHPDKAREYYQYNSFSEISEVGREVEKGLMLRELRKYDPRGNLIDVIQNPDGAVVVRRFAFNDPLGRLTETVSELGQMIKVERPQLRKQVYIDAQTKGREKTVTQDAFYRPGTESDWNNQNTSVHKYDHLIGIQTVVNPVADERATISVKNAFDEVVEAGVIGSTVKYDRDVDGQVKSTTHPDGSIECSRYDVKGKMTKSQSTSGLETSYHFNRQGYLDEKIVSPDAERYKTTYVPNVFGDLTEIIDPSLMRVDHTESMAGITEIEIIDPDNLRLLKKRICNFAGELLQLETGDVGNNDVLRQIYERDVFGNELRSYIDLGDGKSITIHQAKYDAAGHALEVVDGNGNRRCYVYDLRGNLRYEIDPLGYVVEMQYDQNNYLTIKIAYATPLKEVDIVNLPSKISATDQDSVIHNILDSDGLVRFQLKRLAFYEGQEIAAITEFKYDGNKNEILKIQYAKSINLSEISLENIISVLSSNEYVNNERNRIVRTERDAMGRPRYEYDPEGNVVEHRYDTAGSEVVTIPGNNKVLYNIYDKFNNLRYMIDAEGYVKEWRYNSANVCTDEIAYFNKLENTLSTIELTSLFNELNRHGIDRDTETILRMVRNVSDKIASSGKDVHEVNILDVANRVIGKVDGERFKETYNLNGRGLKDSKIDKRGNKWEYFHDIAGNLTSESTPEIEIANIRHNLVTNRLEKESLCSNVSAGYKYDGDNRLTKAIYAENIVSSQREVSTIYDKCGRMTGTIIHNAVMGNLDDYQRKDLTTNILYDFEDREIVNVNEQGVPTFSVYDSAGRKRFNVDGEGYVIEYQYEHAFSEPTMVTHYAKSIDLGTLRQYQNGIPLGEMMKLADSIKHADDRTLIYTYDRNGNKKTVAKNIAFVAVTNPDKKTVDVKEYERKIAFEYDDAGRVTIERRMRADGGPDDVTQHFYDRNGNEIVTISPVGYVTRRRFGMQDRQSGSKKWLELEKIEYRNPVAPNQRGSLREILDNIKPDRANDRIFVNEYDRRHLKTKQIKLDGHAFYRTLIGDNGKLNVVKAGKCIALETEYDEEGLPIAFINSEGNKRYLVRNAVGDVIWETDFPVEVMPGVKQYPVYQHFYNAHRQSVGTRTYLNSSNIQLDEYGRLIVDGLVTASEYDELSLLLMCNRGLPIVTDSTSTGLTFTTYNELKMVLAKDSYATVYRESVKGMRELAKDKYSLGFQYDRRGKLIMESRCDAFDDIATCYQINAFGERTEEGPAFGEYYIHHRYDKCGNRWYTNEDKGIPTITFFDESDAEVVTYRSMHRDLDQYSQKGIVSAKAELVDPDYATTMTWLQRFIMHRNADGFVIQQDTPWYSDQPPNEPGNYDIAFTVVENPTQEQQGHYLRFKRPDERMLSMIFRLRRKNDVEWNTIEIDTMSDPDVCYISLNEYSSDTYEYQLDFYYHDMSQHRDAMPSYRADGEVMLDTGDYSQSTQPLWYMQNATTLVIAGKSNDIYGIELVKDGKTAKCLGASRSDDGKLIVDLSQVKSDEYEFRYIKSVNVLADGLGLGLTGDYKLSLYKPGFHFESGNVLSTLSGSLPAEMSKRLTVKYAQATVPVPDAGGRRGSGYQIGPSREGYYVYWGASIPCAFVTAIDDEGNTFAFSQVTANAPWRFGCRNDNKYAASFSQLPPTYLNSFGYIETTTAASIDAVQLSADGVGTHIRQVMPWGHGYILPLDQALPNLSISPLRISPSIDAAMAGTLTVGSEIDPVMMVGEEISINNFKIDKSTVGGFWKNNHATGCQDIYFNYSWSAINAPQSYLRVQHNGETFDVVDLSKLPLSRSGNKQFFQHKLGLDQDYTPDSLTLSLVKNGDVIPVALNVPGKHVQNPHADEHIDDYSWPSRDEYSFFGLQHLQDVTYDDFHIMYFSRLPEGTKAIKFEYTYTTSRGDKEWIEPQYHMTNKGGLSVFLNNIPTGNYQCRFIAYDANNQPIRLENSRFSQDEDGYSYLTMAVKKAQKSCGQVFTSQRRPVNRQVIAPSRFLEHDRWGNLIATTDRMGNKVTQIYNVLNQRLSITMPAAESTHANGVTIREPLVTTSRKNANGHEVESIAPDNTRKKYLPNSKGDIILDEDADGVQNQHHYNMLRRRIKSIGATSGVIVSSFTRVNSVLTEVRTYPNGSTEEIDYNEKMHIIRRKDRAARRAISDEHEFYHPDAQGRHRVTFHPATKLSLSRVSKCDYHPRNGVLVYEKDSDGHERRWGTEDHELADKYIGNITRYVDLAGQVIHYDLNFNKQVVSEIGTVDDSINNLKLRGITDAASHSPLPRHVQYERDEVGRIIDNIDQNAQIKTHMCYDAEDYCIEYYFMGKDGRVYQATQTQYDELHRIHQIYDTHIMIEYGYDKTSKRRYAKAFLIGDDGTQQEAYRESWYDYSAAGRVLLRDCIIRAHQIIMNNQQGMAVEHEKDRLLLEKSLDKKNQERISRPAYETGNAVNNIATTVSGKTVRTESRILDLAGRVTERHVVDADSQNETHEKFILDISSSVLVHETTAIMKGDDGKSHTTIVTRRPIEKKEWVLREEVVTIIKDIAKGVHLQITDEVETTYRGGDTLKVSTINTTRITDKRKTCFIGHGDSSGLEIKDYDDKVKQATLVAFADSNNQTIGEGPVGPTSDNAMPDGYRHFVVNSEKCYLTKESKDGRNYYFYAQKRPGQTTLVAYFGDLPMEVRSALLHRRGLTSATYEPKVFDMDPAHQPLSSTYPPPYPGRYTADGTKTYNDIANDLNYTGYGDAIAWANNADGNDMPCPGMDIVIPSLAAEIPETATNGTLPVVEIMLGSMYPALAAPNVRIKPAKVDWGLVAIESAAGALLVAASGGLLAAPLGVYLGTSLGAAVAYGLGGVAANAATQGLEIESGHQSGFNMEAMFTQGLATGVSAGVLQGMGRLVEPISGSLQNYQLGDLAANVATAEVVAAGQQAALMITGLQSRPDWQGFATTAFNAGVGTGVSAGFGQGMLAAGAYTAATTVGDTIIRGQRVNVAAMSAAAVGSMLGSYLADQIVEGIRRMPAKTEPVSVKDPLAVQRRVKSTQAPAQAAIEDGSNMLADNYVKTHGDAYERYSAAFWNSRFAGAQPASNMVPRREGHFVPTPDNVKTSSPLVHGTDWLDMFEEAVFTTLGVGTAVILLPEIIVGVAGSMGTVALLGPIAEGSMLDAALARAGLATIGGSVARQYEGDFGLFGGSRGGVSSLGSRRGSIGAGSVMQAATEHPLAGLSPENVVRLADEIGLGTSRDQLILWSGLGKGNAGIVLSQEFARANGGLTLEMTQGGKWLDKMDLFGVNSPFTKNEALQIWDNVSTKMIQQASGQVRAVIGQVRPESIYRAEQAEIFMNNKITGLDELNLKSRYVFGK